MKRWTTMLFSLLVLLSFALMFTIGQEDDTLCPAGQGYWKNHPDDWPVVTLQLGSQFYSADELMVLLQMPTVGDASLILAHQLIAAKLNVSVGADVSAVSQILIEADTVLAGFVGKLPFAVSPSDATGAVMITASGTLGVFNSGLLTAGCEVIEETPEATPETTVEPEITPTVTEEPEMTPEATLIVDDGSAVIVIEGPVTAININIVTIYNINIVVADNDPVLAAVQIGDVIRVQGEIADPGTLVNINININVTLVLIAINVTFVNIEIYVSDTGVWRDDSQCNNPPPPWAPAHGWRGRCSSGGGGDDDDDDD